MPKLTDEQRYAAAKVLSEIGGMKWETAQTCTAFTPRVICQTTDAEVAEKMRTALRQASIDAEVTEV